MTLPRRGGRHTGDLWISDDLMSGTHIVFLLFWWFANGGLWLVFGVCTQVVCCWANELRGCRIRDARWGSGIRKISRMGCSGAREYMWVTYSPTGSDAIEVQGGAKHGARI